MAKPAIQHLLTDPSRSDDMNEFRNLAQRARHHFNEHVQNGQLMCLIHSKYAGPDVKHHTCLGCNFNELTDQLSHFLGLMEEQNHVFQIHEWYSLLSHQLNCIWERITDVFSIVSVPVEYQCRHYSPFIKMRRWANFFKHPKEFGWLVHHPLYCVEGFSEAAQYLSDKQYRIVDDKFVKKYYGNVGAKGLAKEFHGFNDKVVVLLPDLIAVMEGVTTSLHNFVHVVTENPVYVELLNNKTTIENYYAAQEAVATTTTSTTTTPTTTQPPPPPAGSL